MRASTSKTRHRPDDSDGEIEYYQSVMQVCCMRLGDGTAEETRTLTSTSLELASSTHCDTAAYMLPRERSAIRRETKSSETRLMPSAWNANGFSFIFIEDCCMCLRPRSSVTADVPLLRHSSCQRISPADLPQPEFCPCHTTRRIPSGSADTAFRSDQSDTSFRRIQMRR